MIYKALIIEDEPTSQEHLKNLITQNFEEINIVCICDSVALAREFLSSTSVDLVFLDVHLPGENGFELLEALPSIDFHLVFVTGYDRYAIQAIRLQAIDYLLKPVDLDTLQSCIHRFLTIAKQKADHKTFPEYDYAIRKSLSQLYQNEQPSCLTLYDNEGFYIVRFEDILYLKGENNYTKFFLSDGTSKLISKTLKEYENLLEPLNFIRIHKSFIINIVWVKSYKYEHMGQVEMKTGIRLEVSRRRSQLLFDAIDRLSVGTKPRTKFRV